MAITQINGITSAIANGAFYKTSWYKVTNAGAGFAGSWYDMWLNTGMPSTGTLAGSLGTGVNMNGSGSGFTTGRISCGENVQTFGTFNKHLINAEFMVTAATAMPCWLMLVDMLAYYPGIVMSTTTAQTVNSGGTSSLTRYTNGQGVMMYMVVTTALTTPAASTTTITYNNGSGSRTTPSFSMNSVASTGIVTSVPHSGLIAGNYAPFIPLQSGDSGVVYPTAVTVQTTQTGGTCALVLCKPLAMIPVMAGPGNTTVATARDFIFDLPSMPRIYDGACLNVLLYASGAIVGATNVYGTLDFVWG